MNKKRDNILVLNVHKKDASTMNDFADFNAAELIRNFGSGSVFYFSDYAVRHGIKKTEARIKKEIVERSISIVVFAPNGDNYELSIEFFRDIGVTLGVKNVLLVLDDDLIFDIHSKYYSQVFDAVITCDYFATFAYRKLGVPALYYFSSYRKEDFYPVEVKKDIDVSFIGDCTKGDRMSYINLMRDNGIDVQIFGDGSPGGFISREQMPLIFSRSRVNLNFTKLDYASAKSWFLEENNLTNLMRQNKGRPMEISLSGAFCLSEYTPSIDAAFEIEKEIDVFNGPEDLLAKVRYYIENEDIREQMAESAYRKALNFYEADVFIPGLTTELREVLRCSTYPQRSLRIFKDYAFKRNHTVRLAIIFLYHLSRLRFLNSIEAARESFQYGPCMALRGFFKALQITISKVFIKARERRQKLPVTGGQS